MSDHSERLLSAARRYCTDRFGMWAEKYAALSKAGKDRDSDGYHYTEEALRTFPRYNVLGAIQTDIERLTGRDLGTIDEARETVALAGLTAQNDFTDPMGTIDEAAMQEERQLFAEYVRAVSCADLEAAPRLPYRRVISEKEADKLRNQLTSEWGVSDGHWYPLAEKSHENIEAYQDRHFQQNIRTEDLRQMLRSRGIGRVFEVREYGPSYELDVELFEPEYNGAEGYWVSDNLGWVMYASHESSITVGGWLLDEVKVAWPNHTQHIWQTPFFE